MSLRGGVERILAELPEVSVALAERGQPSPGEQCAGHDLILMDDHAGPIADVKWLQRVAARAHVRARVNGREPMARLAAEGMGLACLPVLVGNASPELVRVDTMAGAPGRTLWLGAHRDRRRLQRVELVAAAVRRVVGEALPRSP